RRGAAGRRRHRGARRRRRTHLRGRRHRRSRMRVEQVPYKDTWPREFEELRATIARAVGDLALRIDHIGSTSVPGMSAKDVIDIQITVTSLDDADELAQRTERLGFVRRPYFIDHIPPGWQGDEREWGKIVLAPPDGM